MSEERTIQTGRIDSCKTITVIEVQFLRGLGVEGDILRRVTAWFTPEGELIAEKDMAPNEPGIPRSILTRALPLPRFIDIYEANK